MYRRLPDRYRRYVPSQSIAESKPAPQLEDLKQAAAKAAAIPLPNEDELPSDSTYESERCKPKPGLLQGFFNRIQIDDLILVGLIILLLDEGLDSMEDDFLLVILLYLLIGRN